MSDPPTAATQALQTASGFGILQVGAGGTGNLTINVTNEQLQALLLQNTGSAAQGEQIERLSRELQTTQDALKGFFATLRQEEVPPEKLAAKLLEIASNQAALTRSLATPAADPKVGDLRAQARTILQTAATPADYQAVDALLTQAVATDTDALDEADALVQQAQQIARARRLSAAESQAQLAQSSLTQLKYREASERYQAAANLLKSEPFDDRVLYLFQSANALFRLGHDSADTNALRQSVTAFGAIVAAIPPNATAPLRAILHIDYGHAQRILGEREGRRDYLDAAYASLQSAVLACTRGQDPSMWAAAQDGLSVALLALADMADDPHFGEQALAASREANSVDDRQNNPERWAMARSNLGSCALELSRWRPGTDLLHEAIQAFQDTLTSLSRQGDSYAWAHTQNNLALATEWLALRDDNSDQLKIALSTFQLALEERPREQFPLLWAQTTNSIANVYRQLAAIDLGTANLEKALATYKLVLQEYTRERVPLQWASVHHNLGLAYLAWGQRETTSEHLQCAVDAFKLTLEERTRDIFPLPWGETCDNLGTALATIGQRENDLASFQQAVPFVHNSILVVDPAISPAVWASRQLNLADILTILGDRTPDDTTFLQQAIHAYQAALTVADPVAKPRAVASVQERLGQALLKLSLHVPGSAELDPAIAAFTTSRTLYLQAGLTDPIAQLDQAIAYCESQKLLKASPKT